MDPAVGSPSSSTGPRPIATSICCALLVAATVDRSADVGSIVARPRRGWPSCARSHVRRRSSTRCSRLGCSPATATTTTTRATRCLHEVLARRVGHADHAQRRRDRGRQARSACRSSASGCPVTSWSATTSRTRSPIRSTAACCYDAAGMHRVVAAAHGRRGRRSTTRCSTPCDARRSCCACSTTCGTACIAETTPVLLAWIVLAARRIRRAEPTTRRAPCAGCDTSTDDRPDHQAQPRADDEGRAGRRRHHDGVTRAYCSHWVCQVSFEEPIVMASVSPKHDTHPLIVASGRVRGRDPGRRPGRRRSVLQLPGPQVPLHRRRVPRDDRPGRPAGRARTASPGCAARRSSASRWPTTSCSSPASSRSAPGD